MENFETNIHISNKKNLEEKDFIEVNDDLKKYLENLYTVAKEKAVPIEESLGVGSLEKMNTVYGLVKAQLHKRGLDNVVLVPTLFMKESRNKSNGSVLAMSYPTHIEMYQYDIEDESLRQLEVFRTLAHELYHSVGRSSWEVSDINTEVQNVNPKASGASNMGKVGNNNREHGFAFEEGAAVQFEGELFEEIKKIFPAEIIEKHSFILEKKHWSYDPIITYDSMMI